MRAGEEGRTLSPTDVAHHLACRHRTQLERQRRAGTLRPEFHPDARLDAMRERGQEHERRYVDSLRTRGVQVLDLTGQQDPAATLAAMQAGAGAIVQAPLGDGDFFGYADVLLRCNRPSPRLGAFSYEPVDTKLAAETKAGALLQLLTYCELLATMQGLRPERFCVVTPLQEETYRTADFNAYFGVIRRSLKDAHTAEPAPATYPEPVPHCDVCSYWLHCDRQRARDDHPSLIAGAGRGHVRELEAQGLPTLQAFAESQGLPQRPARGRAETYHSLHQQARLQFAARTAPAIPLERLAIQPGRGLARLPEPDDGDVFLDFEGDPFVGAHGLEYLTGFGWLESDRFVQQQLWALDHAAEKAALQRFLDFVAARLVAHPKLHVYHFGAYEVAALRRLCSRHDTRSDVLDRLLRGERFVDLHRVVKEGLRIGVAGYGLKELEPVFGFERRLELPTAGEARRDLELCLELQRGEITAELRQQVAAYNADDCRATAALRLWLEGQVAAAIAAGHDVPRPQVRDGEPKEKAREREQRVTELRDALLAGLPAEDERDDAQRARALLADLVGYFWREERSAWWEHFRLRELDPDERLDEREMVAGLQLVDVIPPTGKQQHARCVYAYPPQEHALEVGKSVYLLREEDPATEGVGTKLGAVEAIDHDRRRFVVPRAKDTARLPTTAVFRDQVVPARELESALLAFGEHVRDHGFATDGPFARACDLLLRRPPRANGANGALRRDGEDALAAALRLCRELGGGVLPVQGPPGTGKSFTGGHAIAALTATARIGVTAVSHKVIDNLLAAARSAAAATGRTVRLVHKHDEEAPDGIEYTKKGEAALDAIGPGTVVGGTAWLWAPDDAAGRLDYLFVDEAGQMSLAQLLAIARCADNLVLLGDPQQLEQPHQGAHPDGADVAALTHLLGERHTLGEEQGLFLAETWRLAPALCAFTSELYYDGRLLPRSDLAAQRLSGTGICDGQGHFLLECQHEARQAHAPEEVDAMCACRRRSESA